jgi:effector-binding domain-containing protein
MLCCHRIGFVVAVAAALTFTGLAPAFAQAPAPPTPPEVNKPAVQPGDAFGEEVTLTAQTMVYFKGSATWDQAYETLTKALKSVNELMQKQGVKAAGPAMTIYTATDDTGFQFLAGFPVAEAPKDLPAGDISVGKSPEGAALKFVHRGSYDSMETTYDAITNYLDERQLEAKDQFVEQYVTDPLTTADDKLVIEVYVPVK